MQVTRPQIPLGLPTRNWRPDAGVTLVELLIAMAVTAIVLTGLFGVTNVATRAYEKWEQPLKDAQDSSQLQQFAVSLQADGSRYLVCGTPGAELDFCLPGSNQPALTYTSSQSAADHSYEVVRTFVRTQDRKTRLLVRSLPGQPQYKYTSSGSCAASSVVRNGRIDVAVSGTSITFTVYFRGPLC